MNTNFSDAMGRAAAATRAQNLTEATRIIQRALAGASDIEPPSDLEPAQDRPRTSGFRLDPDAEIIEPETASAPSAKRLRMPLDKVLRTLREARNMAGLPAGDGSAISPRQRFEALEIPDGARFLKRTFSCSAGARSYKLHVPAPEAGRYKGLLVMLHGCKQTPDDFAIGTGMNALADRNAMVVVYPGQTSTDNLSNCWNWFRPGDQRRGTGEPAILAGLTRELVAEFGIDRSEVFVAGLSAGGAMAAVLGECYPDLYSAVGIHSGVPTGVANDVISAFAAMRGDGGIASGPVQGKLHPRTIVFHGTADRIVSPGNGARLAAVASGESTQTSRTESGRSAGGRGYSRRIVTGTDGSPRMEYWQIEGAGHAWSGGKAGGSYTDPTGPDASAEMLRFFLDSREKSV